MHRDKPTALVVDRECDATRALIAFLRQSGFSVLWAHDDESAFHVLDEERPDCLVAELHMRRIDGFAVLRRARERNAELCAVVVTEGGDIEKAVEAMRQGAYDFQVKPLHLEKLLEVLRRGLEHQRLVARAAEAEERLDRQFRIGRLVGRSRPIARVLEQIRHLASSQATVLIEGEAGTGKGVVARTIHQTSPRKGERFVWMSCGALAPGAIEGELFGQQGSHPTPGRLELADGGTLFLDEIDKAPPGAQLKLLRLVQNREFERVGGHERLRADVRLIAASHLSLAAEVESGRFREDLYQRLGAVRISMPPLRERSEDVPLLVECFLRELNRDHRRKVTGVTRGLLERLTRMPWPGNVRELRAAIEGMVAFAEGRRPLDLSDLPEALREPESAGDAVRVIVGMTVQEAERALIAATLRHTGHDKPRAAAMLRIGLRTLYRKAKQYGIRSPGGRPPP